MTVMLLGYKLTDQVCTLVMCVSNLEDSQSCPPRNKVRDTRRERTGSMRLTFPFLFFLFSAVESFPMDYFYLTEEII